jgi:hypothetical protein
MSKEMHVGLHLKCLLLSSISDFMTIQEMLEFLFTYLPHFNRHNSLPFLRVILKKLHLLLKMPFGWLATILGGKLPTNQKTEG